MTDVQRFTTSVELPFAEQHMYDVIVVGAGPAGSSTAFYLARQGADVLLLDRRAFPRDKSCGDGIMPPALEELALMGIAVVTSSLFLHGRISTAYSMFCAIAMYDKLRLSCFQKTCYTSL